MGQTFQMQEAVDKEVAEVIDSAPAEIQENFSGRAVQRKA